VARAAAVIALVAVLAACGGGGRATFTNPVWPRDFPDPFLLKVDDTYWAYATNGSGKEVQTLTSKDLVHWSPGADALPKVGRWAYPGKTWAPEVIRANGAYVLYYTANGGGQCVGRAVADSPDGPFVDRWGAPLVCQRSEGGSIDPSPFRDDDGTLYLYWKNDGNSIGHATQIWAQRLSGDGTRLVGPRRRIETNDLGWEAGVVEGPVMWRHDGRYYLFYSGNDYASDYYAVGYATCTTPLGPCRDAPENPILKGACRAAGPGHNSLIDVDGETWIVYHAWLPNHVGDKRVLWIDRLDWRDGKPVVHGPTCEAQPVP
jgi:beta-xylosidase